MTIGSKNRGFMIDARRDRNTGKLNWCLKIGHLFIIWD